MQVYDKKIFNDCAGFGITETPSFYLTVVPVAQNVTLFGKQVSELQTNVATDTGTIVGTLNYVLGYTGFSSKTEEQSGHYLALKATAQAGTVISATLVGGSGKIVTLDDDGMIVFRITSTSQKVQFMATKDGETYTMTLPLTNVVLAPLNFNLQVTPAIDSDGAVGGKYASDLQENVVFGERATGTLKYVSGYSAFVGDNQDGHFLMLKASAIQGATITAQVLFYVGEGSQVVYGADGLIVCRLESNSEEIEITASLDGQTTSQRLSLYFEYEAQPQPSLTPFEVGDNFTQVQFASDISDTDMDAIVANNDGAVFLAATVGGYPFDVINVDGGHIFFGTGTGGTIFYNATNAGEAHGWQEDWTSQYASWDATTRVLTAAQGVTLTVSSANATYNGVLFGKVVE